MFKFAVATIGTISFVEFPTGLTLSLYLMSSMGIIEPLLVCRVAACIIEFFDRLIQGNVPHLSVDLSPTPVWFRSHELPKDIVIPGYIIPIEYCSSPVNNINILQNFTSPRWIGIAIDCGINPKCLFPLFYTVNFGLSINWRSKVRNPIFTDELHRSSFGPKCNFFWINFSNSTNCPFSIFSLIAFSI